MRRTVLACATRIAALGFSAAHAQNPRLEDILSGAYKGSVKSFTVNDDDSAKLAGKLHVTHSDSGRNLVSKLSDPDYNDCWNNIGTPIVLGGAAIGASLGNPLLGAAVANLGDTASLSVIDRADSCERNWTQKVHEAFQDYSIDVLDARVGQIEPALSGAVGDILNLQNRVHELNLLVSSSSKDVDLKIGNLTQSMTAVGDDVQDKIDALSKGVKSAQSDIQTYIHDATKLAEINARLQSQQDLLQGSVQVGVIIGQIAFAKNPVAAAKLDSGLHAVQSIGQSIINLGKPGISTGLTILSSANIAGAGLALVGLLGGGNDGSAVLLQQVNAVRGDISELREEMNDRFDRVEAMLVEITNQLNNRLNSLDKKLDQVLSELSTIDQRLVVMFGVDLDSFKFLIQMALSSAVTLDPALDVDESANRARSLKEEDKVAYLGAVLKEAVQKGIWSGQPSTVELGKFPNPGFWDDGIDGFASFLAGINSFRGVQQVGLKRADFVHDYAGDIQSLLIPSGELAIKSIAQIRRAGAEFAVQRYKAAMDALAATASNDVINVLTKKDLQITTISNRKFANITAGHGMGQFRSDGTTLYSIMYHNNDYYVIGLGPEKGREWRVKRQTWRWVDIGRLMCQNCEGTTEQDYTRDINRPVVFASLAPSFNVDFDHASISELADSLPEINTPYLNGVFVPDLSAAARALIVGAQVEVSDDAAVGDACKALIQRHQTIETFSALMRGSYGPLDDGWLQALAALPCSTLSDCKDFVRQAWVDAPDSGHNLTLAQYLKSRVSGMGDGLADKFLATFKVGEHESHVDSIEARLGGLRNLGAESSAH